MSLLGPTRRPFGLRTFAGALAALLAAVACTGEPAGAPVQAEAPAPATEPAPPAEPAAPTPPCNIPECFRPVECVAKCGTPVLSSSCCAFPEGQLDQLVECPPPHVPTCAPDCSTVCDNGVCTCECNATPESGASTPGSSAPTTF
jgi:hypothetical protein